jgi:4TM region of DNA translocase FtsK/SpoIIIE
MSRKSGADSNHGFNDVIGVALLAAALLLLVAQWSFDRYDLSFFRDPHNKPVHDWIGTIGAYIAWFSFIPLGLVGYILPWLLAMFGVAYLLNFLGYLRERLRWSLLWAAVLLLSLTGLLYIMDSAGVLGKIRESIGSQSAGGWLGYATYGQTTHYEYGFCLLGNVGATIVYATLCLISLLFLTNFKLGEWIRDLLQKEKAAKETEIKSPDEALLERRARELENQAKKLQDEVARSGLGADLQPVPEPTAI